MRRLMLGMLLLLTGCWAQNLRVEDVARSPDLRAKATEIPVAEFFDRRMFNRPRKALVGNWMILYDDAENVYLGYPRFSGVFSDRREIEELFRTSRPQLDADFPGWKEIDGEALQKTLRQLLGQIPDQWDAWLTPDCIRVKGQLRPESAQANPAAKSGPFEFCLDKRSLAVVRP